MDETIPQFVLFTKILSDWLLYFFKNKEMSIYNEEGLETKFSIQLSCLAFSVCMANQYLSLRFYTPISRLCIIKKFIMSMLSYSKSTVLA